jgi:adenylate cyclase
MVAGLRSFALYVPRRLVLGLIQRGDVTRLDVETREVTVMFTDIVGFSGRAEGLSGAEVARFLNHHFALLTARIEAEGGTVDKFIGDAVMAFWGAPEEQPDHAARAARAALAIAEDLRRDNAGRPDPVRVRIGLHSGPAVVGNIGAATRMNYTLVGETVNAAARLQELGKRIAPGAEAVVLVSAATRRGFAGGDGGGAARAAATPRLSRRRRGLPRGMRRATRGPTPEVPRGPCGCRRRRGRLGCVTGSRGSGATARRCWRSARWSACWSRRSRACCGRSSCRPSSSRSSWRWCGSTGR